MLLFETTAQVIGHGWKKPLRDLNVREMKTYNATGDKRVDDRKQNIPNLHIICSFDFVLAKRDWNIADVAVSEPHVTL